MKFSAAVMNQTNFDDVIRTSLAWLMTVEVWSVSTVVFTRQDWRHTHLDVCLFWLQFSFCVMRVSQCFQFPKATTTRHVQVNHGAFTSHFTTHGCPNKCKLSLCTEKVFCVTWACDLMLQMRCWCRNTVSCSSGSTHWLAQHLYQPYWALLTVVSLSAHKVLFTDVYLLCYIHCLSCWCVTSLPSDFKTLCKCWNIVLTEQGAVVQISLFNCYKRGINNNNIIINNNEKVIVNGQMVISDIAISP